MGVCIHVFSGLSDEGRCSALPMHIWQLGIEMLCLDQVLII